MVECEGSDLLSAHTPVQTSFLQANTVVWTTGQASIIQFGVFAFLKYLKHHGGQLKTTEIPPIFWKERGFHDVASKIFSLCAIQRF